MLQFHPDDRSIFNHLCVCLILSICRISVIDALAHPYLRDFHGQMAEPESDFLFDFDFEKSGNQMMSEWGLPALVGASRSLH
jgi:hypothetical protein